MALFPFFYRASLWESGSQVLGGFTIQHHWESALCWYCSKYGDTAVNRVNRVSSHWVYVLLGLEKETAHKQINIEHNIKEFCALWYKRSGPETGMRGNIFQTQKESQCDWPKLSERREDRKIGWPKTDHKGPCRLWQRIWLLYGVKQNTIGQRQIIKGLVGCDTNLAETEHH